MPGKRENLIAPFPHSPPLWNAHPGAQIINKKAIHVPIDTHWKGRDCKKEEFASTGNLPGALAVGAQTA